MPKMAILIIIGNYIDIDTPNMHKILKNTYIKKIATNVEKYMDNSLFFYKKSCRCRVFFIEKHALYDFRY